MNPLLRFTIGFFLRVLLPFSLYMAINSYGIDERDLSAADRREQIIPDLPGYLTMKCDFHMHTFLSDGLVAPSTRVGEAYLGGLDAIAITDHVEFRPHHLLGDEAKAMDQAKALAERLGLILISGCEITKGISPGHFNALFITDIDAINQREAEKAIEAAYGQGAFVFYNHPKPETAPMEVLWSDFHQKLAESGRLSGIEIVNKKTYFPHAHGWALSKGLTMMGSSDIHYPMSLEYFEEKGEHRPLTLVFAKERTAEAIGEALRARRTAVYHAQGLWGDEEFLSPLFHAAVLVHQPVVEVDPDSSRGGLMVENLSDIPFLLQTFQADDRCEWPTSIVLRPRQTTHIPVSIPDGHASNCWQTRLDFQVSNCQTGPQKALRSGWDVLIQFHSQLIEA